jgi:hypothetical protein
MITLSRYRGGQFMGNITKDNFESLKWKSCPIREESVFKSVSLIIIIFVVALFTVYSLGVWYGVLALILISMSLSKYFIPTKYELSSEGVVVRFGFFKKKKNWAYYTRYSVRHDGIFLSPFKSPTRVDSFRGDFLRFGNKVNFQSLNKTLNGVFGV